MNAERLLQLDAPVATLDTNNRSVQLIGGRRRAYDPLPLATGAEPVRLDVPRPPSRNRRNGGS